MEQIIDLQLGTDGVYHFPQQSVEVSGLIMGVREEEDGLVVHLANVGLVGEPDNRIDCEMVIPRGQYNISSEGTVTFRAPVTFRNRKVIHAQQGPEGRGETGQLDSRGAQAHTQAGADDCGIGSAESGRGAASVIHGDDARAPLVD